VSRWSSGRPRADDRLASSKAFFYGAFDPKATITIDKLAGSFLPQALSARIFGFHPWSLALPQVIDSSRPQVSVPSGSE
jgi:hypothetical protein